MHVSCSTLPEMHLQEYQMSESHCSGRQMGEVILGLVCFKTKNFHILMPANQMKTPVMLDVVCGIEYRAINTA